MTKTIVTVAVGVTVLWTATARAIPTAQEKCEAGKNAAVGKYAACLQTAQHNLVLTGKTATYTTAIGRCAVAQQKAWAALETKYGVACPSSGDQAGVQTDISDFTTCVNDGLGGTAGQCDPTTLQSSLNTCTSNDATCNSSLSLCTGNLNTANANLTTCTGSLTTCQTHTCGNNVAEYSETCDGTDLHGQTCATQAPATPYGTLACNGTCTGFVTSGCVARFVDNGNGTVTDNQTNLIWEQKDTTSDVHNVNNTYTWSTGDNNADGTAFTSFLAGLNGGATGVGNGVSSDGSTQSGGFAGECDWRLPTIAEFQTIVDCSFSPCINPVFGPMQSSHYWSATTFAGGPSVAWNVYFPSGDVDINDKTNGYYVRAVRSGL